MPEINEEKINRAILVGLNSPRLSKMDNATESTMEELNALLETAGGECLGVVVQNKDVPDPGTFIGDGKVDEVRDLVQASGADMVIFDNAVSYTHLDVYKRQRWNSAQICWERTP